MTVTQWDAICSAIADKQTTEFVFTWYCAAHRLSARFSIKPQS
jgi:hypothetical protein